MTTGDFNKNNNGVTSMHKISLSRRRPALLTASIAALALGLSGCWGGSSSSSSGSSTLTGTFVDSAVAGLDYEGERTRAGVTDDQGQFSYRRNETLHFSIGELALGSATGAEIITPLSITEGADSAEDPRVVNRLILLQTLDADGDLNNGIQLTEAIREEVSRHAADIDVDQPRAPAGGTGKRRRLHRHRPQGSAGNPGRGRTGTLPSFHRRTRGGGDHPRRAARFRR